MVNLLTVAEAAVQLRVHEDTVRRLIARGELVATRIGRNVRIEDLELTAFVRGQRRQSAVLPITPGQLRALHAKADRADRLRETKRGTSKKQALSDASRHFSVDFVSANDLDEVQAGWVLEHIDVLAES